MRGDDPARVLVCDGNAGLAGVLAELLDDEPGFAVIGTATSCDQALELARDECPDVVLVDERLGGTLPPAVLDGLREACPDSVLLLWSYDPLHTAAEGVDGLLRRGSTFREVVTHVRRALVARRSDAATS